MTTESAPLDPAPPRLAQPPTRPSPALTATFVLANLGFWLAFFTPVILTLQVQAARLAPEDPEAAVSLVLGIGSVFGIVTNPVVGRLSDRTTSRFGMRRPWLLAMVLVGFAGLVVWALAPNVAVLVIGGCLTQIGFAGGLAVLFALLPDQFPVSHRGRVGGLIGVTQAVAVFSGVALRGALVGTPALALVVPGAVGVLLVALLCLVLRDRRISAAELSAPPPFWTTFWVSPRRHPDFGWAWLSRFAIFLAFAGVLNYQLFFLVEQLGLPQDVAARTVGLGIGVQVLGLVITSFVAGRLSDRVGRRRPFVLVAALLGAVGLLLMATATALPQWIVAGALIGIAQGMYYSVDLALVADVLPDRDRAAAKNFGLFSIANLLPQTLAPALAPLLFAVPFGSLSSGDSNYTAFFVVSAVIAVLSAVTILPVRGVR